MIMNHFSSHNDFLSLELEELAGIILQEMHKSIEESERERRQMGGMRPFTLDLPMGASLNGLLAQIENQADTPNWPKRAWPQILMAATEAWGYLVLSGFIIPHPADKSIYAITRRGAKIRTKEDVKRYTNDGVLPVGLLHPRISRDIQSHFAREHYETVVFHAFKELEVAIREAVQGPAHSTGKEVVKAAFNPTTGLFRNQGAEVPNSEREAEYFLFDGAIAHHPSVSA